MLALCFHVEFDSTARCCISQALPAVQISDADSQYVRRSDCDTLFIVANYQPDKKDPSVAVNDEHALMRFEFLEAIVRLAVAKYGKVGLHLSLLVLTFHSLCDFCFLFPLVLSSLSLPFLSFPFLSFPFLSFPFLSDAASKVMHADVIPLCLREGQ